MELAVGVLLCLLVIAIGHWLVKKVYEWMHYSYPPGPKGWPVVGITFDRGILNNIHTVLFSHKALYGDVSYFKFGRKEFIVLNTIDAMKEAMNGEKNKVVFAGRPPSFLGTYVVPNNLSQATYSKHWARLRKLTHTMITPYTDDVRGIEDVIINELRELKGILEKTTEEFDIKPRLERSIGNVIFTLISGKRFDYDHEIHECMKIANLTVQTLSTPLANQTLSIFPFLRHFPYGFGAIYQDLRKNFEVVFNHLREGAKQTRNNYNTQMKKSFLRDLQDFQRENTWLSDDMIHDIMVDLLVAGIVTTSSSLYILLLVLLHKPEIQKRIQDEIDGVVGYDREPCLADKPFMPYTRAVIIETLRSSAFLPIAVPHSTIDDVNFRGFRLKKDMVVLPNVWSICHDDELWEEPWQFKPERFLNEDGLLLPPEHENRRNIVMFGLGKRRCIGEAFARNRLFLFLAHLCQRFTFHNPRMDTVSSMDPRDFDITFLVAPKPYKLVVSVRDQVAATVLDD